MTAETPIAPRLRDILADIPDPLEPGGRRYPLVAVLLLICAAILSGCDNPNRIAAWGKRVGTQYLKGLGFRRGKSISKSPLYALLGRLHGRDLEERVQCWVEGVAAEIQGMGLTMVETEHAQGLDATRHPTVTIGNETPQKSPQPESNPWHMLSAVLLRSTTTLVRVPADGTTLEIPLAAVLRERLHLENQMAPDDAQLTPKAIAQAIAPQEKSTR